MLSFAHLVSNGTGRVYLKISWQRGSREAWFERSSLVLPSKEQELIGGGMDVYCFVY